MSIINDGLEISYYMILFATNKIIGNKYLQHL
jgi:hypothetical protein